MPNHGMPVFRIEDYIMSHHSIPCHTMPWVEIPDTMQCLSFVYHLSCTVGSFSLNISDKNEIGKVVILKKTPVFIKVDENSGIFRWSSDLYWEMQIVELGQQTSKIPKCYCNSLAIGCCTIETNLFNSVSRFNIHLFGNSVKMLIDLEAFFGQSSPPWSGAQPEAPQDSEFLSFFIFGTEEVML